MKRVFAVFAHNEADHIIAALDSIERECSADVHVLVNGSTDGTLDVVREYAVTKPNVQPVMITVADKANAWNVFVHEIRPDADVYYFMDGDCRIAPGAIEVIESRMRKDEESGGDRPNAYSSTPPEVGRRQVLATLSLIEEEGLQGALYALTREFVIRLREKQIYLPKGVVGDDGLVGALAHWDLEPATGWKTGKIAVLRDAKFEYDRLSPWRVRDLKLYFNRRVRYSVRHLQNRIIKEAFHREGLDWLYGSFDRLYREYGEHLNLRWRGVDTVFDYLALRRIRTLLSGDR